MELYLAPYTGTGTRRDPFRPVGADEPGAGSIDLRPDPSRVDGYALVLRPSALALLSADKIGDDFRSTFGAAVRNRLQDRLRVDLTGINRFDVMAAKLLMEPPANGWNPLRPSRRRLRYEIFLAGQLVWEFPVIAGGATDTFTYSNGELNTVSGGLWVNDPDSGSTLEVDTNRVKITTEDLQTAYVYNGAAVTADQYSQCQDPVQGFAAGGPAVRIGAGTGFCCYAYWPAFDQLLKYVNNSVTLLGSGLTPSYNTGETMEVEAEGTSISALINGVELTGSPVTDSSLTTAGQGVGLLMDEAVARADNWEGGDLSVPPFTDSVPEIAFDAATESVRTATTDPYTFDHTPVGTPRGVILAAVHGTSSTDHISSVTYGGVAMSRVRRAVDTTTEPGAAELWFLGAGIPTGTQTVSVDLTSATGDDFHFVLVSLTTNDGGNVEVVDSDIVQDNVANPSVTLQYEGRVAIAIGALYAGGAAPSDFTPNGNCQTVHDHDLGAFYSEVIRQITPGNADFAIGGTALSDDVAFVAAAFANAHRHRAPAMNLQDPG